MWRTVRRNGPNRTKAQVTYASKLEKGELDLDPADPAAVPGAQGAGVERRASRALRAGRTRRDGAVADSEAESDGPAARFDGGPCARPGAVFAGKRLLLGCAEGAYEVRDLKPDGKQAMDAARFRRRRGRPCAKAMRFGRRDMPDQNTDHRSDRPDHGRGGRPGAPLGGGRREGGPQPDRDRRPQGDGDRRPQPDREPQAQRLAARPATASGELPQDGRPPRGGERRGGRTFSDRDGRKPQGDRDRGRKPQGDRPQRDGERRNRPRREVKPADKTAETEKRFDVSPARKAALQVGRFLRERDAFAQDLISKHIDASRMSREDRAFATRLVLGVVSARGTLDEIIDRSLRSPDDVQDDVRDALRIGVYEMYFLDKSPHAAVDQCVELVRTFAPKACGLANAVLRKASSLKGEFPFGNPQADLEAFARQYAFPVWLAKRLVADLGLDAAREFMEASNEPAPLFAAVNAACATDEEVRAELEAAHGEPEPVEIDGRTIPGCYRVSSGRALQDGRIKRMLNQGKLLVSDAASQEVARLVLPATLPQSFLEIGARTRHQDAASAERRAARVRPADARLRDRGQP